MPRIPCRIVRWVSDDPVTGVVEAVVRDIDGNIVRLVDKYPVFTERQIGPKSVFPIHVRLPVQVMTTNGRMSLVRLPYGLQEVEHGTVTIRVPTDDLAT